MLKSLRGENARERTLHRLHSVALVLGGLAAKDVAQLYGDSPRSVAYWVTKFKASGGENLGEKSRPGRPSRLDASQTKRVRSFVEQRRGKNEHVNAATLSAFIKASFNVALTQRQCWRILKEIV